MHYDPIKQTLGRLFNRFTFTRKIFYHLLNILLLRAWHIRRELRNFPANKKGITKVNVLDAGCGFGQYSFFMAKKNPAWNILGLDVKTEEIKACQYFFEKAGIKNATFNVGDLTNYRNENFFDLILSVDVMEHIEEDQQVFNNFYVSLKPGGLLLISTPSDLGGSGVISLQDKSFIEEHVRNGYAKIEIEQKLKKAGFDIVETKYTYGRPGNLSWIFSLKVPIMLLGVSKLFFIALPLYYLLVIPWALILNLADIRINHPSGTGLMVKAIKN